MIAGGISGANSTVSFATPTVASGSTDVVTIVVKDNASNAVSGLASSAFSFTLTSGTSAGNFGAVSATTTPGTYTALFTGTTAGTASTLTTTVNGVVLATKPTIARHRRFGQRNHLDGQLRLADGNVGQRRSGNDPGQGRRGQPGQRPRQPAPSSFALAGGTSAGAFSTVSATATPGTYTATFTGVTAGTASTLTATVSGITLTTKPTVQVTAGAISGANSTVSFATPTVGAGNTDVVTVVVKDNASSAVSGIASSAFSLALAGGTGTSAGAFGAVSPTTTPGTYTAVFTATTAGTAATLTATVSGVTLATTPTVQVTAAGISGANSTASFASPTAVAGNTDLLTIVVKDTTGNAVSGLASNAFGFTLSGGTSAGSFGTVSTTATPGKYTALFTGTTAGTASSLTIKVNGVTLGTQPTIMVTTGSVSATTSTVSFASSTVAPGSTDLVTILVKDGAGNAVSGLSSNSFGLSRAGGTSAGTFSAVTAAGQAGTYSATFTATTAGTASTLTAIVSGVTLNAKPAVQVVTAAYPPPANLHATPGNGRVTFSFDPITGPVSYYPYAQLINGTLYPIYVGFSNPFTITANNAGPLVNGKTYTFEVAVTYASGHTSAWSNPVTVTVGGTTAAAPTVSGVTPASGPATGGTTVTIIGTNFTGATGVAFGGKAAASFTVASATQITATEPAGTAGQTVDITVTTPGGTSATTTADKFKFLAAPTIITQPANVTVTAGQPATFTVVASGDGLSYQWQKRVGTAWVNVSSSNTSSFTGATKASFTIASPGASDAGTYWVVVSSAGGTVDSSAVMLTVNAAVVAPKVTLNPSSQTVTAGNTVTLTASASGSPTPSVQWQTSTGTGAAFANIPGATSTTYSFTAQAGQNGALFRALFTNSAGQAISSVATLTLKTTSATTTSKTIGAGQQLVVRAGQTVTGVTILAGGYLLVLSGGTDIGTINNGGDETVQAGGTTIGATITNEADLEVYGSGSGLVLDDGYINVDAGGNVTGTTINGDIMYVASGGTAINTTIAAGGSTTVIGGGSTSGTILNGGEEFVRSGAVTTGTTVNSGGTEYVFAGGVANNLTLTSNANATVLGKVNHATINHGATVTVFDGGSATDAIVDNGTLAFSLPTTNTFTGQLTGNGALAVQGRGKLVVTHAVNNVVITVGNSSSLELGAAASSNVTLGYQSTLKLDDSQAFTGTIAATPNYQDVLDLGDVPFILGVTTVQFVENAAHTQGILTVSDKANGGPTVQLTLLGNFSMGTFSIATDGGVTPGTLIKGPF